MVTLRVEHRTRSLMFRSVCELFSSHTRTYDWSRLERGTRREPQKLRPWFRDLSWSQSMEKKTPTVDLISASQISCKAWSQPISAFPQRWKSFLRSVVKSWHEHKTKRGDGHIQKQRKQGFFGAECLCPVSPSHAVRFNWSLHRGQTPVACFHKLACLVSDPSSYLTPAG